MTIEYIPPSGDELGYWHAYNPDMQDMEEMVFKFAGETNWYRKGAPNIWFNFVVIGTPVQAYPEWLARHPGWETGIYDYAVSYSIQSRDVGDMLDDNETVLDAFNYYLEGTGQEWKDIEELRLVDRRKPWDNAVI